MQPILCAEIEQLIGKPSSDIDLVVDGISAELFAEKICVGSKGVTRAGAIKVYRRYDR